MVLALADVIQEWNWLFLWQKYTILFSHYAEDQDIKLYISVQNHS